MAIPKEMNFISCRRPFGESNEIVYFFTRPPSARFVKISFQLSRFARAIQTDQKENLSKIAYINNLHAQ